MAERKQFVRVKGAFSRTVYIPRAGKIKLGLKAESKTTGKTYPKNVDYFVCPEPVARIYGAEPTELKIMFPTEDETQFFPQRLEWWKAGGLACHGDGEEAQRWDPEQKTWIDRTCPCEHFKDDDNPKGECSERAHLLVLLPDVSLGSAFQIDTGSYHGVVQINSMIAAIRTLVGRISYVPLVLRRVVREITREGKREKKAILELAIDPSYDNPEGINTLREQTKRILDSRARVQIEAPKEEAPTEGPVDLIEEDDGPHEAVERVADAGPLLTSAGSATPGSETLTLTLNPDGAERERQAYLSEAPLKVETLLPSMPGAKGPIKKPAKPTDNDAAWEMWHNGALKDMQLYERTCKKLNIPMGGKPINRAVRPEFKRVFEELCRSAT